MLDDMATKGLNPVDVARAEQMAPSTVTRFLNGQRQTVKTAARIAAALGSSVRRYLVKAAVPFTGEERRTVGERREGERRDGDRRAGAGA